MYKQNGIVENYGKESLKDIYTQILKQEFIKYYEEKRNGRMKNNFESIRIKKSNNL